MIPASGRNNRGTSRLSLGFRVFGILITATSQMASLSTTWEGVVTQQPNHLLHRWAVLVTYSARPLVWLPMDFPVLPQETHTTRNVRGDEPVRDSRRFGFRIFAWEQVKCVA
jgi:hypothetical protein